MTMNRRRFSTKGKVRSRLLQVESLEQRLLLAADFGDAPSPYATLLAEGGARHEVIGPRLGVLRDAEIDGAHSAAGDADDFFGADDEDGVDFSALQVGQADATVTVGVAFAAAGAKLDAWIDFNGDGSWFGNDEQIATSHSLQAGSNTLTFVVPANIASGIKNARFRLSTTGGLSPFGPAADGEVEDHQVSIAPPAPTKMQFSGSQALSDRRADELMLRDLDQDGDLDMVSLSGISSTIQWHENVGSLEYLPHTIYSLEQYLVGSLNSLDIADVDGDGDLDLLTAGDRPFSLGWLENDGLQNFTLHEIVASDLSGHVSRAADVDGDGDCDVVAVIYDQLKWFENDGNQSFVEHAIGPAEFYSSHDLELTDIDRDGDLDLVIQAWDSLRWFENAGGSFASHSVWETNKSIAAIAAGDLDGDGDQDLVSVASDGIVRTHRNQRESGSASFDTRELESSFYSPSSVVLSDLDGDGHQDFVVDRFWFKSLGNGQFEYRQQLIEHQGFIKVHVADLDGDGDLDLLAIDATGEEIAWFENSDYYLQLYADWPDVGENSAEQRNFRLYRRTSVSEPLTVIIRVEGTAQLGVDYTLSGATPLGGALFAVLFPTNVFEHPISIATVDDDQFEQSESIDVSIVKLPNYVFADYSPSVTVVDDEPADWGDAPAPYPTTASAGGPRHGAMGPMLGTTRDGEADGQPTAGADGDDEAGDPTGGIVFAPMRVGEQDSTVTVFVTNAPAGALLEAWVDFNGDGNWGGEGERIFADRFVTNGVNALTFDVPRNATAGDTYARFRLSSAGGLGLDGEAADGEVEDVRVALLPPTDSAGLFAVRPLSSEFVLFARQVELGDMDGDGDLDFVSSGSGVRWYEMENSQVVGEYLIAPSNPVGSGTFEIELCDLDGDGDMDILVDGSTTLLDETPARFFWLENRGGGAFDAHRLADGYGTSTGFSVADIEGDGDLDIVGYSSDLWLMINDGAQNFTPQHVRYISDIISAPLVNDIDADGDLDIVVASNYYNSKRVILLENVGGSQFYDRTISVNTQSSITRVALADLDGDGDEDVVWSGSGINWSENKGGRQFSTRQIGYESFDYGDTLAIADINGDGLEDIVVSTRNSGARWWQRLDNGEFVFHESSKYWLQSSDVGDVDGDGDLDLIGLRGAAPYTITIEPRLFHWFENVSASVSLAVQNGAAAENGPGTITYSFRRSGLIDRTLNVAFHVGGGATFGSDYQQVGAATFSAGQGSIVFPVGVEEVQLKISPLDDAAIESNETIALSLAPGRDYRNEIAAPAVGRIVDNEAGDFGDAPGPYPTSLVDDGARHGNTGPRLGARRDAESDGSPAPNADGDDATSGDDGDGVLFGEVRGGQGDAVFYVYVANALQGARIDAWIDIDGDGNWNGLGERIAASVVVVNGLNEIRFAVPVGARSGNTFARVRLSSAGGLGPTGAAADGEVEDYRIWVEPPVGPGGPFAKAQPIASQVDVFAWGDLDRDGDTDLVTLYDGIYVNVNQFLWHENTATGLVQHELPLTVYIGQVAQKNLVIADMNGDGWNDLLALGTYSLAILVNDRAGGFTALPDMTGPSTDNYQRHWLNVFDVDADGDNDILAQAQDGTETEVALFRNRGDATFVRERILRGQIDYAEVTDIDGDGDLDLIGVERWSWAPVVGYNDGSGELHVVSIRDPWYASTYEKLQAVDLDGDGDQDILASGSSLSWFENLGSEGFAQRWLPGAGSAASAVAADVNGDGKTDVIAARVNGQMVAWYQNLGNGEFTQRTIDGAAPYASMAVPVDMDGDGDLDVVVRGSTFPALVWYENLSLLEGDYNGDGHVDTADYAVWRNTMGQTGIAPYSGADGSGNGSVGQEDYAIWKSHFGESLPEVGAGGAGALVASFSSSDSLVAAESVPAKVSENLTLGPPPTVNTTSVRAQSLQVEGRRFRVDARTADAAVLSWVASRRFGARAGGVAIEKWSPADSVSAKVENSIDQAFQSLDDSPGCTLLRNRSRSVRS